MPIKIAVAALALVVSAAASAHGQPWSRHAPLCRTVYPENQHEVYFWGGLYNGAPYTVTVLCPIPDTSDRPDSQITEVLLYVTRNHLNTSFSVRACRTARIGLGSECGAPAVASSQNAISLLPGSIWQPTDFGYLEVTIGGSQSDAHDGIEGYVLVY